MKIRQMITSLFVVLSVIPLLLLGFINMAYNNNKLERLLRNDLVNAVSTQVKAIENFYEERQIDVDTILAYPDVKELLEAPQEAYAEGFEKQEYVEKLLKSCTRGSHYVESSTITNRNFVVAACSDPGHEGEFSGLAQIDEKYLSPSLRLTNVINTREEGARGRIVAAVQQIFDGNELIGYIVLELNLNFFEEVRASARLFNNGTIYLIDGKEQLVVAGDTYGARDSFQLTEQERADYTRAWQERDPDSRQGILEYEALGNKYLSCYFYFDHLDWRILSSVNQDDVLQTGIGYRDVALIIVGELLFLLIAVNYLISRYLGRPVAGMIDKFRRIRENQDYSIRMDEIRNSEIGTISTEVNYLLDDIENYIESEKQEHARLRMRAETDPLTGLYNKTAMEQIMQRELSEASADNHQVAALFLDIDNFKDFNTIYGHMGGDKVLQFVADCMNRYLPGFGARQGGDEFVSCIVGEDNTEGLETRVKELIAVLNRGLAVEENKPPVSIQCSIGVACAGSRDTDYESLLKQADEAMYAVKCETKNGYRFYMDGHTGAQPGRTDY